MHGVPHSQGRALMEEKRAWARHLMDQGLNDTQISRQLTCSASFVRSIRRSRDQELHRSDEAREAACSEGRCGDRPHSGVKGYGGRR
jgi:hypothetical protein